MTSGPWRLRAAAVGAALLLITTSRPSLADETVLSDLFGLLGKDVEVYTHNVFSIGVGWRVEERDPDLIGKASLDPSLCAPDDCISLSPSDTAPNRRYLAAPGSLSSNFDDGNLNYAPGDIVFAPAKWTTLWRFDWSGYRLELGGLAFYDAVNTGFREKHPNRIVEPGPGPGEFVRVRRQSETERAIGYDFQLREANLQKSFDVFGRQVFVGVGRQRVQWGEAALALTGTLDFINPPEANNLFRPGFKFFEVFKPVGMILMRTDLAPDWQLEAFTQLEWRPFALQGKGSIFSFADIGDDPERNEFLVGLSKFPEDPEQLGIPALPVAQLVTATSFSIRRGANREPSPWGQGGIGLSHYLPEIGPNGTEVTLYFANYHSRLPSVSANAAQAACTRREGNPRNNDTRNAAEFLLDCGILGVDTPGEDFDALPLETAVPFLEFPKNILLFGLAFHLEALGSYWQGEAAFRPNQPVQVDLEDVLFAALQPIFPRNTIEFGVATLANSRRAIPDFLTAYRGGEPGEIAPGQYVRGYERMETLQFQFGWTRLFTQYLFGGLNDTALLVEVGGVYLPTLPSLSELQFEGTGTNSHAGPGIADTGDALKINPIRNTKGYVTDFSWGFRTAFLTDQQIPQFPGVAIRNVLIYTMDVDGVGPGLAEPYIDDRQVFVAALEPRWFNWRLQFIHAMSFGGGVANVVHDKDSFAVALIYEF